MEDLLTIIAAARLGIAGGEQLMELANRMIAEKRSHPTAEELAALDASHARVLLERAQWIATLPKS